MVIELNAKRTLIIGIVADTHVPDRAQGLHPGLIPGLVYFHPDYIFHAGDICSRDIVSELEKIAPVYAVRGNRDFLNWRSLPMKRQFRINGVDTLLAHGHINPLHYWLDKAANFKDGYQVTRFIKRLRATAPLVKVYIFGHSHHAENLVMENRLYFNPGSCSVAEAPDFRLSFGIIRFATDASVTGEIISLSGATIKSGKWVTGETTDTWKIDPKLN